MSFLPTDWGRHEEAYLTAAEALCPNQRPTDNDGKTKLRKELRDLYYKHRKRAMGKMREEVYLQVLLNTGLISVFTSREQWEAHKLQSNACNQGNTAQEQS